MMIRKHIQMKFNLNDSKGLMYIIIKCKHKHFFLGILTLCIDRIVKKKIKKISLSIIIFLLPDNFFIRSNIYIWKKQTDKTKKKFHSNSLKWFDGYYYRLPLLLLLLLWIVKKKYWIQNVHLQNEQRLFVCLSVDICILCLLFRIYLFYITYIIHVYIIYFLF